MDDKKKNQAGHQHPNTPAVHHLPSLKDEAMIPRGLFIYLSILIWMLEMFVNRLKNRWETVRLWLVQELPASMPLLG